MQPPCCSDLPFSQLTSVSKLVHAPAILCYQQDSKGNDDSPAVRSSVRTETLYVRFMAMYSIASNGAADTSVPQEGVMPLNAFQPAYANKCKHDKPTNMHLAAA